MVPPPYERVNVPAVALTALPVLGFGVTVIVPSVDGSIVTVEATVLSGEPGVDETTLPIEGVSLRSPGSMTGSRSSRPVRSVPTPPLMNSGPWTLLSWFSCGANTCVSPPSTCWSSTARTQTVRGESQLVLSNETGFELAYCASDWQSISAVWRQTRSCCW